jgi:hypothetical protein
MAWYGYFFCPGAVFGGLAGDVLADANGGVRPPSTGEPKMEATSSREFQASRQAFIIFNNVIKWRHIP